MPNIGPWQLAILLLIVLLLFGTKRLRNIGSDLGGALKGFRKGLADEDEESTPRLQADPADEAANSTADAKAAKSE